MAPYSGSSQRISAIAHGQNFFVGSILNNTDLHIEHAEPPRMGFYAFVRIHMFLAFFFGFRFSQGISSSSDT